MFSEAEFDAPAVTVWNIAGQLLPRVREFARSDQLILVGHIVEVHARLETVVVEKIAELPVVQPLRGGILPVLGIGEVAARRLLLRHGERHIDLVIPGESVVHARFGVEKVIGTVNIQLLKRRSGAVEIVVGARNVMPDETVLQVGIEVQPRAASQLILAKTLASYLVEALR